MQHLSCWFHLVVANLQAQVVAQIRTSAWPPLIQITTPLFWKCCKSSWGCRSCARASAWCRPAGRRARAQWNRARWLARWGIHAGARRQHIPDSLRSEPEPAPSAPECPDIEHHSRTDEAKTEGLKRNRLEVLLHSESNTVQLSLCKCLLKLLILLWGYAESSGVTLC